MRPAARAGRELEIWFQEARNIQGYPRIYHVYTSNDIPCISMDVPCIYFVDIPCISLDIHGISTIKDMYGISKDIPCIYHTYTIHMDQDTIWMVYTRHIPGIYQKSGFQMYFIITTKCISLLFYYFHYFINGQIITSSLLPLLQH